MCVCVCATERMCMYALVNVCQIMHMLVHVRVGLMRCDCLHMYVNIGASVGIGTDS